MNRFTALLAAALIGVIMGPVPAHAPNPLEKQADGVVIPIHGHFLKLQVRADNIIRVAYAKKQSFFGRQSLMLAAPSQMPRSKWHIVRGPRQITVATAKLQARVNLATGSVAFFDPSGRPILAEKPGVRRLEPANVQGENTFHVRQEWQSNADESLYSLGQHQFGLTDIKGYDMDLWQHNTNVVIPFLVSSRGYGILWDNTSFSRFGDLRPLTPIAVLSSVYIINKASKGLSLS